jgi:hypothetical protein
MADDEKPQHPLALGGKRPEPTGNGRPRKPGDRYRSGKLKRAAPNQSVLDRRAAICADPTMATCPLDASYANGWLSKVEYGAGRAYISVHARAGIGGPGAATQRDNTIPTGAALELAERWSSMTDGDVRRMRLSLLPDKEVVLIWDSAMRDLGRLADPEKAEEFARDANQRWRSLNAAMTSIERMTVDNFCIRETWPRWFWERQAGRMDSRFEEERDILIGGLRAMARAMEKPKTVARVDLAHPRPAALAGPREVERRIYQDEETGETLYEAVRIKRRG